jgi:hypothetical protein
MALSTTDITGTGATTVYTSVNETAITFMSLCNRSASIPALCNINAVEFSTVANTNNLIVYQIEIQPGDTYILYHGGEKILLSNGDFISITSDAVPDAINVVISYVTTS